MDNQFTIIFMQNTYSQMLELATNYTNTDVCLFVCVCVYIHIQNKRLTIIPLKVWKSSTSRNQNSI